MAKSPNSHKDVGAFRLRHRKEKSPARKAAAVAAGNHEGPRARLEGLAALISDGLVAVGRDGRCTYVNPAAARFLRRRAEDLVGRPLFEVLPEVHHALLAAGHHGVSGGHDPTIFETYCASLQAWFECRCHPSLDGVNLLFTEVTPRRRAADTLRESEQRRLNEHLEEEVQAHTEELRSTVERLQDEVVRRVLAEGNLRRRSQMLEAFFRHTLTPLVFLDRCFNFVRVNKAYAEAAGEEPQSFAGRNYFVLRPHEEDRPIFEQMVRTKQPYFAHAKPFVDPHNPQRPATYWDWCLTPLLGDKGQVQFLVLNLQDVTEAQQAYAALEHRAGQLQKLTLELSQAEDRERKRISELLHEDVQQVLAGAKFHLNLFRQRIKDNEDLRQSAEEVAQMLNEAIAKSRSLSHELSPALYEFDLDEMLAWLLRNMAERHGLTVALDVRGPLELPSEPVKALLYKIAQELLFNVVKHAGVRQATVRLRSGRGRLRLTVADRGQGFDAATLTHTDGFGLMSIRERVGLLGGRVKIRSTPGKGTLVSVTLPADTGRT